MMLSRVAFGRQLGRLLRVASHVLLGIILSISLNNLLLAPSSAQVTVPNQASIQYDAPGSNPTQVDGGGIRTDQLSNVVTYPFGSDDGDNNLGLGITKTADKAAAEPGDVVVYRLVVTNESGVAANTDFKITDLLPRGVQYVDGSATGSINGVEVIPDDDVDGQSLTLSFPAGLESGQTLNVFYAATLTPDSLRGNGINVAEVMDGVLGTAEDNFRLTIRAGILSDCGTIVGRVFVDNNFDGQQQPGEPGIPNAVIYMDSGNRIITDPDGLFSLANAISGNRVGALDISSLPGYTIAPNLVRIEGNSQSRLVRLEPGGLARMNFAVTPTFGEGEE
ncbi:MAG: isopeptide-forming domain-containing fimbrial protein [Cyanobacteria bacterium J06632_3]